MQGLEFRNCLYLLLYQRGGHKYSTQTSHIVYRRLPVFPAVGGRCLPGRSAVPGPLAGGSPDMPALRGAACNSSSLS